MTRDEWPRRKGDEDTMGKQDNEKDATKKAPGRDRKEGKE